MHLTVWFIALKLCWNILVLLYLPFFTVYFAGRLVVCWHWCCCGKNVITHCFEQMQSVVWYDIDIFNEASSQLAETSSGACCVYPSDRGAFCFICTVWFGGEIGCNWNDTNWGSVSTWERQTSWLVFSQTGLPDSRCWFCCSMAKRNWRTDSMRGRALLWGTWLCPFITAGKAGSWRNPRVQISCLPDSMSCENNAA